MEAICFKYSLPNWPPLIFSQFHAYISFQSFQDSLFIIIIILSLFFGAVLVWLDEWVNFVHNSNGTIYQRPCPHKYPQLLIFWGATLSILPCDNSYTQKCVLPKKNVIYMHQFYCIQGISLFIGRDCPRVKSWGLLWRGGGMFVLCWKHLCEHKVSQNFYASLGTPNPLEGFWGCVVAAVAVVVLYEHFDFKWVMIFIREFFVSMLSLWVLLKLMVSLVSSKFQPHFLNLLAL